MYYSSIAQQVEQSAVNRSVVGSSPTRGAIQGPLVKRLRHRPFTAVSGVRFPHGSPYGRLAQLGERLPYKQDVGSSILSSSTTVKNHPMDGSFFMSSFISLCSLWVVSCDVMQPVALVTESCKGKSTAYPSQTVFHNVCSEHAVLFFVLRHLGSKRTPRGCYT